MSEELLSSVQVLLGSKKSSRQTSDILHILELGKEIFTSKQPSLDLETSKLRKKLDLKRMDKQERILKILEGFTSDFEASLSNNFSTKEYLLFLVVVFKLSKKIKSSHQRSIVLANTLSKLDQMFVKYPLNYSMRTTVEPLSLLFLLAESNIEASRSLESPYKMEQTIFSQFLPLMTRFCIHSEDPLQEIVRTITEMPKFRINTSIGEEHKKIFGTVLQHCFPRISSKIRIETGTRLFKKIISEQNDSIVLSHFNTLKLLVEKDVELKGMLSKLAKKEITQTRHRRFVNGILEELGNQS
jgi:hypothetical protein